MEKIKKAVITAAGLGTRMLPISYAVAKEMLPIVDLPAVYFLVKEAVDSGITDVLIITAKGKEAMEDFFDIPTEYYGILKKKGMSDIAEELRKIKDGANLYFMRQNKPTGIADAIRCARSFVGTEPFCVLYGDDVIFSRTPVLKQLIGIYEKYQSPVVGIKEVSARDISKYSSLKVNRVDGEKNLYLCSDMIEKPREGEAFSNLSILGRALLTPDIFDYVDKLTPGIGGEIQLTDAMAAMAREKGIYALDFEGKRYDMGSKTGLIKANIVRGLSHPETQDELREFIKMMAKDLNRWNSDPLIPLTQKR